MDGQAAHSSLTPRPSLPPPTVPRFVRVFFCRQRPGGCHAEALGAASTAAGFVPLGAASDPVVMSSRANRQEARRAGFKKAIDGDEARRKREDHQVEIRKAKREENLMKKRRETTPALGAESGDGSLPETTIDASGRATDADLSRLAVMVAGIQSDNSTKQMEFTLEFRKLLSIGTCGRGVCVCVGYWGRGLQLRGWPGRVPLWLAVDQDMAR